MKVDPQALHAVAHAAALRIYRAWGNKPGVDVTQYLAALTTALEAAEQRGYQRAQWIESK